MRIICFSFFVLFSAFCVGEVNVAPLKDNGSEDSYNLLPYALIFESEVSLTPVEAHAKVLSHGSIRQGSNLGYTNSEYWLLMKLENDDHHTAHRILEIGNPHIDSIDVYKINSDANPELWIRTGDAIPFNQRLVDHRNFLFPISLNPNQKVILLIRVTKKKSSLIVPIRWWNANSFFEADSKNILGYGLYFGFLALCLVYACLTFFFLRKRIYFWYALWVLTTILFVGTSIGLSFQFVYPGYTINNHFRVIILIFSLYTFVSFAKEFLQSKKYTPFLHKVLTILTMALLGLIPTGFMMQAVWQEALQVFLGTVYGITVICLGVIFLVSIVSFSMQKRTVIFYYLAFGAIIVSSLSIIYSEFGSHRETGMNSYMIGSAIELLIFSIALTYRIKKLYQERNELSIRMVNQQKEMLSAYVNGIERERERISLELHDDIGSRLSNLKRYVTGSAADTSHLDEQIDGICNDVRNLSHQLAPPSLQLTSVVKLVKDLAEKASRATTLSIHIQQYDFPEKLAEETQTSLFRIIQEALENTTRHSGATDVEIQFFGYEKELVITFEDNGRGFEADSQLEGIGIKNIRTRVNSLGGKFEIQSSSSTGTILIIQLPRQPISLASALLKS